MCAIWGTFASACAFTDRHVDLSPPVAIQPSTVPPASPESTNIVTITRPQDLRPDPTTIGNIRNGYGMVTAQIRSNNDVALWVANSLGAGLEQAGFRVERAETIETAQTPLAMDIGVSRVFAEHTPGFFTLTGKGDVAAQIEVYRRGQRILRRVYAGKYETTDLMAMTSASEYQEFLNKAMEDLLQKAIPDLSHVLSQELGRTGEE